MLSVLTGSFDKTEKLAPSSQQVCLTFLLKKFFELSEIDSAESKNKKSAFFLSKNRSMNYPDGCIKSDMFVHIMISIIKLHSLHLFFKSSEIASHCNTMAYSV